MFKIKHLLTRLKKMMSSKSLITKTLKSMKIGATDRVNIPRTREKILKNFSMMQKLQKESNVKSWAKFITLVRIWGKSCLKNKEDAKFAPCFLHVSTATWNKIPFSRTKSPLSCHKSKTSKVSALANPLTFQSSISPLSNSNPNGVQPTISPKTRAHHKRKHTFPPRTSTTS